MQIPTFPGVLEGRRRIALHLPRTPLFTYPQVDRLYVTAAQITQPFSGPR